MKIALFGGTFDPIHEAHLRVAREAADQFGLGKVWFVTSSSPPHKPSGTTTPYAHRHRMVEIACKADHRFEPSRLEDRPGRSYSIDTIRMAQAKLLKGDELLFLIGADAFAEIGTWHRSGEVLKLVDFIVVSRPGYEYPIPEGARVYRLESLALPVSSSEIRRRLDAGEGATDVPPGVLTYIQENRLYR